MSECSQVAELTRPEPGPRSGTREDCEADSSHPVRLRMCLVCGLVGCSDSSRNRHATRHFQETGHAVTRSVGPGESRRWCYADGVIV